MTTTAPATVTIDGREFRTRVIDGVLNVFNPCGRCNGAGYIDYYAGIYGGVCFECHTARGTYVAYDVAVKRANDRAKRAAAAARKEDARLAAQATELAAWIVTVDPAVIAGIEAAEYGILLGFADQIKFRPLSARQYEVAVKVVAEQAAKAAARAVTDATARTVGYLAPVGDKVAVAVEVTNVREFDGDYGVRYLVTAVTAEGHVLKTWNSGEFGRTVEKGDKVTIKATVKAHDEYQGTPQTELTRVRAA